MFLTFIIERTLSSWWSKNMQNNFIVNEFIVALLVM
jgi:hypothetical protein